MVCDPMTQLLSRLVSLLALFTAACTFIVSGPEMDGRVLDSETAAPISGALVIAEWSGDIGGPVQSSEVCFHLEVATTDADGRYHIPAWTRRPVADWEGGFFGLRNVEISRRTYKRGYVQSRYDPNDKMIILMVPFEGGTSQRIEYLRLQGTRSCGRFDGSREHEKTLWKAICQEAKDLPEARISAPLFAGDSFLREIDRHFAHLSDDITQTKDARNVELPRVCR
jgi:hypothetical protein